MKFKIKNKKIIKLLLRSFILSSFLFLFFVLIAKNSLAADFRVNVGSTEWKINSNGIFKNNSKINCADIQIGSVLGDGFLVKNSVGNKLLLIDENNIHTSGKSSFSSLTYPSSLINSFILKKEDNDILLYVDAGGLHYQEGMCISEPVCGNGIIENGEECDDGNTISGDGCSSSCVLEYCSGTPSACSSRSSSYCNDGCVWNQHEWCKSTESTLEGSHCSTCGRYDNYDPLNKCTFKGGTGSKDSDKTCVKPDSETQCYFNPSCSCNDDCEVSDGCSSVCLTCGWQGACVDNGSHVACDVYSDYHDCQGHGCSWGSD